MMKKVIFGSFLLVSFLSTAVASEDDFPGLRAGLGYSDTSLKLVENDVTTYDESSQRGFKVEVGYDFNRVIALDVSYQTNNDSLKNITNDYDADGEAIKVGAEFGYAFYSKRAFLKPYGKLGFVSYSLDDYDYDENSVFAGVGLRFQYLHFYTDLGIDSYFLDVDEDDSYFRLIQTDFTLGYKF